MTEATTGGVRLLEAVPELEGLVLRHAWYECGSAGVEAGGYVFAEVTIDHATLCEMTNQSRESALDVLATDVELVECEGVADHWEDMLDGEFSDDSPLAPVMLLHEDGWEVLVGMHRTCAHVLHGEGDVTLVVGMPPDLDVGKALERYVLARFAVSSPAPMPAP